MRPTDQSKPDIFSHCCKYEPIKQDSTLKQKTPTLNHPSHCSVKATAQCGKK